MKTGSAHSTSRAIADGEMSCEALATACLERVEAREATVGAWAHLDPELVLRSARALDRSGRRGPLHGVPVGVKDVFATCDQPTQYGSPIYAGYQPAADAACVALVREAGALIFGKTVTTEFATMHPGRTANPHDPARTPGGSSSGSAAAVGDGMVPLAFGTQTAGSTIRPASYCGIVGYKPSFGIVPRAGVVLLSETLDTIGVFGRTIDDVALLAAVASGRDPGRLSRRSDEPPRIGLFRSHEWDRAESAMQDSVEDAARRLAEAGATVSEVAAPERFVDLANAHWTVLAYETTRSLAHERLNRPDDITPTLHEIFEIGLATDDEEYEVARQKGEDARLLLDRLFDDRQVDVLITPAAPGEAPVGLETTGDPILNRVWTLLHAPCISVPVFTGPAGLPMGLQVVGRRYGDAATLAAADWIWKALDA